MNPVEALLKQANAERRASATNLRIGQLIDLLEKRPANQEVKFDFCGFRVESLGSYRGYYEDLALEPIEDEGTEFLRTVGDLLKALRDAVGKTFEGYKGGDYVMDRDTVLWAARYGSSDSTAIVGVTGDGYQTIIETKWMEV